MRTCYCPIESGSSCQFEELGLLIWKEKKGCGDAGERWRERTDGGEEG